MLGSPEARELEGAGEVGGLGYQEVGEGRGGLMLKTGLRVLGGEPGVYATEGVEGREGCFMAERRGGMAMELGVSELLMVKDDVEGKGGWRGLCTMTG